MSRRLSRRQRGSNNRRKQGVRVARIHAKVAARRLDHHHKLSTGIADRYRLVAVEDNLTGLGAGRLARNVHDAGWGQLYRLLEYKLEERGGRLVRVDPRGTSQTCSRCAAHNPHDLSHRTYTCHACGLVMDRDVNAAKNILAKAFRTQLPRETGKVTPAETGGPSAGTLLAEVPVTEAGTSAAGLLNPA
ncbi:MAG: transposase [Euryarchaeota archaeon]|nr:transposase [Euryarchaeota archaeon]